MVWFGLGVGVGVGLGLGLGVGLGVGLTLVRSLCGGGEVPAAVAALSSASTPSGMTKPLLTWLG